jgi:hypothetical protein
MAIPLFPHRPTSTQNASPGSKPRPSVIRYVGFRCTAEGREYSLRVEGAGDPRLFTLIISHAAFAHKEARFQDAPDLCFAMLQRELAADSVPAAETTRVVTAADLAEYREAQARHVPGRKHRPSFGHS